MISFKTSPVAQRLKSEDSYRLTRPHPDSFSLSPTAQIKATQGETIFLIWPKSQRMSPVNDSEHWKVHE